MNTEIDKLKQALENMLEIAEWNEPGNPNVIKARELLQSVQQPERERKTDNKPYCKNYLPYITDEMFEDFGETDLMTWDRERSRPHWTQIAIDFAAELNIQEFTPSNQRIHKI